MSNILDLVGLSTNENGNIQVDVDVNVVNITPLIVSLAVCAISIFALTVVKIVR